MSLGGAGQTYASVVVVGRLEVPVGEADSLTQQGLVQGVLGQQRRRPVRAEELDRERGR